MKSLAATLMLLCTLAVGLVGATPAQAQQVGAATVTIDGGFEWTT